MSRFPTYDPLSAEDEALLVSLADPVARPPTTTWSGERLARLIPAIDSHGVMPVAARKLREAGVATRLTDRASAEALAGVERTATLAVGQSLLLQFHGRRVMADLAAAGVEANIVKGPVFATRLYPYAADRPFTDIDIIVDRDRIEAANTVIKAAGFELWEDPHSGAPEDLQEFKWLLPANPNVMIELHGDLTHSPGLRRKLTFGRQEMLAVGEASPEHPVALLMIAVVHAAGNHKFFRMQLLVDVLQAVRALPADAEAQFLRAARRLGAEYELAVTLNAVGRVFDEEKALRLAALLPGGLAVSVGKGLVTRRAVLDAPSTRPTWSRLQRDAYRLVQKTVGSRGA